MKQVNRLLPLLLLIAAIPTVGQHRRVVFFHLEQAPYSALASGINNHGEVAGTVGTEMGNRQGFVWANGRFREIFEYKTFPPPHIFDTHVYGINDRGDTVGSFASDVTVGNVTFVRDRHGHATPLPPVNGTYPPSPLAINDAGTIVGSYAQYAFILVGGHYTLLAYPGAETTTATGINRWGTVVGWYSTVSASPEFNRFGFIYSNGHFQTTFQCVDGGVAQYTEARAINDWGEIAGNCGTRMFVRDRFGTITFVNLENVPTQPTLTGINNRGDLTGYSLASPGLIDSFVMYGAAKRH